MLRTTRIMLHLTSAVRIVSSSSSIVRLTVAMLSARFVANNTTSVLAMEHRLKAFPKRLCGDILLFMLILV